MPLISQTLHYARSAEGMSMPLPEIRRQLIALAGKEGDEPQADAAQGRSVDWETCRFAVCAWADEIMLTSLRTDAAAWTAQSLQHFFFQTSEAGVLFFQRLEALLAELSLAPEGKDPDASLPGRLEAAAKAPVSSAARRELEAYALCLLLGFDGRCFDRPDLQKELRRASRKVLENGSETLPALAARRANRQTAGASLPEFLFHILFPLLVTALFGMYCANILADIPQAGL
jgi:type VI protein secretion system component VasF